MGLCNLNRYTTVTVKKSSLYITQITEHSFHASNDCRISSFFKVFHCCKANLIAYSVKFNVMYVIEGGRSLKHNNTYTHNKKSSNTYLVTEQFHFCCFHNGGLACFSSLTTNRVYFCDRLHFSQPYCFNSSYLHRHYNTKVWQTKCSPRWCVVIVF